MPDNESSESSWPSGPCLFLPISVPVSVELSVCFICFYCLQLYSYPVKMYNFGFSGYKLNTRPGQSGGGMEETQRVGLLARLLKVDDCVDKLRYAA